MDYITIIGIAVGLAMDAFAVSLTNGAITKKVTLKFTLKVSLCFGFFQFFMPMIGWSIGKFGATIINKVDHWIAFILLSYIGGKMIYDSIESKKNTSTHETEISPISFKMLITLAIATSIDALTTGIILPSAVKAYTHFLMLIACLIIGVITFIISFLGVYIGKKFGTFLSSKSQLIGGLILIFIGIKILIESLL